MQNIRHECVLRGGRQLEFLIMPPLRNPSTFQSIVQQRCPRCRVGKIFRNSIFKIYRWPKMYEHCPECGLKFEREGGYFLGAMYISYGLGVVSVALIAA